MRNSVVRKVAVSVVLSLNLIVLSSCASQYASNADKQYLSSRNGNSLVIPSPMTSSNISQFYYLPTNGKKSPVSIIPPN